MTGKRLISPSTSLDHCLLILSSVGHKCLSTAPTSTVSSGSLPWYLPSWKSTAGPSQVDPGCCSANNFDCVSKDPNLGGSGRIYEGVSMSEFNPSLPGPSVNNPLVNPRPIPAANGNHNEGNNECVLRAATIQSVS